MTGGATIAEVLRQASRRLVHKQWLILYPLALVIIHVLAFLAVYGATGGELRWSAFFSNNFERWQYLREEFLTQFALSPSLGIAVIVGLTVCLFTAMLRAPLFRAIAGPGYPLAPRGWEETARLSLFYVFFYLVVGVMWLAVPAGTAIAQLVQIVALAIALLLVYADYVIVFEGLGFVPALARSVRLVSRRWPPVLLIFVIQVLVLSGLNRLYELYYASAEGVFLLVPLSEILVWSFISLVLDLLFIFLFERVRNLAR
jgi:hypothetical protein